jgi:hypothetical protein
LGCLSEVTVINGDPTESELEKKSVLAKKSA